MPTFQDDSVRTFVGHTAGVTSVDVDPDGYTALSGSWMTPDLEFVKQWDLATGKEIGVRLSDRWW